MGMNGHGALKVIVDIETFPIADAAEYLDLTGFSAPTNWKDPEKIAANIKEQQQQAINKAALDLDLCRMVCIGWLVEGRDRPTVMTAADDLMEAAALEEFWGVLDERSTIGYNQVGFDLPILLRRSLYLNVPAPMLNLDKYRSNHIDLQQRLSMNGTKQYRSLNWYCKRMKFDVPCDLNSGKDIGQLVTDGKWAEVAAHCEADVLKTAALAERMGILKAAMHEAVL